MVDVLAQGSASSGDSYFGDICYFWPRIPTLKSYELIAKIAKSPDLAGRAQESEALHILHPTYLLTVGWTLLDAYGLHVKNRVENWRRIEKIMLGFDCKY